MPFEYDPITGVHSYYPLTNVTPFTYRDGSTFQKLLTDNMDKTNKLIASQNDLGTGVVEELNGFEQRLDAQDQLLTTEVSDRLDAQDQLITTQVTDRLDDQDQRLDAQDTAIADMVDETQQWAADTQILQDAAVTTLINDEESTTHAALNNFITETPIEDLKPPTGSDHRALSYFNQIPAPIKISDDPADLNSLPIRNLDGTIKAADPVSDNDLATKKYVDENAPEAPVSSVNTKTGAVVLNAVDVGATPAIGQGGDVIRIKIRDGGGTYGDYVITPERNPSTSVSRDAGGRFKSQNPSDDFDVANKRYVDSAVANASGAVDSVNGKTGAVVLNASDVGAATEAYVDNAVQQVGTGDVSSVNGQTGIVTLNAADVGAATEQYVDDAIANIPGGGGAVDSVNGKTGVVVLEAADVGAAPAPIAAAISSQERVKTRGVDSGGNPVYFDRIISNSNAVQNSIVKRDGSRIASSDARWNYGSDVVNAQQIRNIFSDDIDHEFTTNLPDGLYGLRVVDGALSWELLP